MKDINKILGFFSKGTLQMHILLNDAKKQHIFEAVGNFSVMSSLLPHVV